MLKVMILATVAASALVTVPALAQSYSFNFAGPTLFGTPSAFLGSGTFVTSGPAMTVNGQTAYAITGITGTFDGSTINGLQAGFLGSDNLYFITGPTFVDGSGVGFTNAAGTSASLYYQSTGSYRVSTSNPFATGFVTATSAAIPAVGAVPEPATWAMMILGMAAIGFVMRRRKNVTTRVQFA